MENKFENCSYCKGICEAGGLFPIDTRNEVSMERPPGILISDWSIARDWGLISFFSQRQRNINKNNTEITK